MFNFRNTEYKGNRLPDSFMHLLEAAKKIKEVHIKNQSKLKGESSDGHEGLNVSSASGSDVFFLTYQTEVSNQQRAITND